MARFLNRGQVALWQRETQDMTAATRDEAATEGELAEVRMDVQAFLADLRAESRLIDDLEVLRVRKADAAAKVSNIESLQERISAAKKQWQLRVSKGRMRASGFFTKLGVGPGMRKIDPEFARKMTLWEQEQAKEMQMLEKETVLAVAEAQAEIGTVGPVIQLNKQERDIVKRLDRLILDEDRRMLDDLQKEMENIKNSRDQLRREKDALAAELTTLKMSRGVVGSFSPQP